MKRIGFLFEKIVDLDNLYLAEKKARRGKKNRKYVREFINNLDFNIKQIHKELSGGTYNTGKYSHFTIYEPKARNISKLPYKDRIVHHAIINILEPIFVKSFISQTYSCIKHRGIHKAFYTIKDCLKEVNWRGGG